MSQFGTKYVIKMRYTKQAVIVVKLFIEAGYFYLHRSRSTSLVVFYYKRLCVVKCVHSSREVKEMLLVTLTSSELHRSEYITPGKYLQRQRYTVVPRDKKRK